MVITQTSTGMVDERKRKKTMDKAMGVHLSRQLQLRLQYAKLKVDHGWQKQNLNEVENLYFRHSHIRGPRTSVPSTVQLNQAISTFLPAATPRPQSSMSFMQNIAAKQLDTSSQQVKDSAQREKTASPPAQPVAITQLLPSPFPIPENRPSSTTEPAPIPPDTSIPVPMSVGPPPNVPTMQSPSQDFVPAHTFTFKSSLSIPSHPASQSQPKPVSTSAPAPAAPPPRKPSPVTSTSSLQTSNSGPPTKPAEPFQFGPNSSSSTLTYDSFWSSHLASRTRSLTSLSGSSSEDVTNTAAPTNFLQRRLSDVQIAQSLGPSFAEYMSSHSHGLSGGVQAGKQNPEVVNRLGTVGKV
ncbi:hypothetical protein Moror_2504 [Moniliophthora roreri MCA 2997]|uniref:Uncharacterized protein n=1 Tax=Moniliophthora roreri (strain MCA 2997) TaxID=1381753 RepID=V2XFH5_MONRO|nr:hypothetical protein Moror_2504 [Moniliophthora roreri MCA 2997]